MHVAAALRTPVAVSIRGVERSFGGVTALDRVSLDVYRGEFFSLLGPSGCGKTTLLRIIAGFESLTGGEIEIAGRNVVDVPAFARRTNMVFQHGALFPHLTVARNIAFGLEMKRMDRASIAAKVERALEMVQLEGYGTRRIDQLSGGQRQRIALARALVNEPEVLLLDEPLSALDLHLRLQMQEELRLLQKETGATFIFVTHDQGEAIRLSDRLAVMQGGRILQVGTPREVYDRPVRRFVAEFMGQSNVLSGTVAAVGDGRADLACGGLAVSGWSPQELPVGAAALVSIRYERVRLAPASTDAPLQGVIIDEIYMGSSVRRKVLLDDGTILVSEASNASAGEGLDVGTRVGVAWAQEAPTILRD